MSCSTATPSAGRTGADWPRAAEGIQLAGFAVFLLLNTMGYLPWSFWLDAIALWPLLIMSAGIRIAFDKTRARWLVLAGPALLLGGLAWLASGARPEAPAGPWQPESAARPDGVERVELEAKLVGARLSVAAATNLPAGRLVDGGSIAGHDTTRLETDSDGSLARVHLNAGEKHGMVFLPRARERWDLRLPAELPLGVLIRGAGVGGTVDLTAGALEGLRTEGVFIGVDRTASRAPAGHGDPDERGLQLAQPRRARGDRRCACTALASPSTRSTAACAAWPVAPATTSTCRASSARSRCAPTTDLPRTAPGPARSHARSGAGALRGASAAAGRSPARARRPLNLKPPARGTRRRASRTRSAPRSPARGARRGRTPPPHRRGRFLSGRGPDKMAREVPP